MNTAQEYIIQKLLEASRQENFEYADLKTLQKTIFPHVSSLIAEENMTFMVDLKGFFPEITFQQPHWQRQTAENTYKRQGGGDFYSYVKLEVEKIEESILKISEKLPESVQYLIENVSKSQCYEWILVYPHIVRAIIDTCLQKKAIGLHFTVIEVRFHPVDFRDTAYYICTKKLLEKFWEQDNEPKKLSDN